MTSIYSEVFIDTVNEYRETAMTREREEEEKKQYRFTSITFAYTGHRVIRNENFKDNIRISV